MRAYPASQRAKATGWWSMVGAGAPVTGLIIGGPLAQAFGWRSLFVFQAGITAASLLLAVRTLPRDQESQRTRVDLIGAGLLIAGVLAVLFAINELPTSGVSVLLGAIFAAGLVILALFTWRQLRITYPLIRMSFFRKPTFCLAIAIPSCLIFGYFGGYLLTPIYLETATGDVAGGDLADHDAQAGLQQPVLPHVGSPVPEVDPAGSAGRQPAFRPGHVRLRAGRLRRTHWRRSWRPWSWAAWDWAFPSRGSP